jgi:hypothetical protein
MILLVAGLSVWILVMMLVVALCHSAALGDRIEIAHEAQPLRPRAARPRLGRRIRRRGTVHPWAGVPGLQRHAPGRD